MGTSSLTTPAAGKGMLVPASKGLAVGEEPGGGDADVDVDDACGLDAISKTSSARHYAVAA